MRHKWIKGGGDVVVDQRLYHLTPGAVGTLTFAHCGECIWCEDHITQRHWICEHSWINGRISYGFIVGFHSRSFGP